MDGGVVATIIALVGSLGVIFTVCLSSLIPLLIIGGIFWFIFNQRNKARAEKQASQTWPSTKGKLLHRASNCPRAGTWPLSTPKSLTNIS
jgi:hypothetical protein